MILPSGVLRGDETPGKKLNVAGIGLGGQIQGHLSRLLQMGHHIGALCDVDANQIAGTRGRHKAGVAAAKDYRDYRVLFEKEKSLDAVVIATPDHWHAAICRAAMEAGLHVYCEKPLTHTVPEARGLRELSKKSKVVTQTGNQGSASGNLRRSIELIQADFFGAISDIHVWHPEHGWPSGDDRPDGSDDIPAGLDWDFWLGAAPVRPYKSGIYHPAKWRGWYDFGNGSLGDFCCHGFNMPVRALELDYPTKIDIVGTELGKESFARSCTVTFHFPARGERGPVKLHFYTGGDLPPENLQEDLKGTFGSLPRTGCILEGEKGQLESGLWNSHCYVRLNGEKKFLGAGNHKAAKEVPESLPRVKGHIEEWVDACAGGPKVFSDFDTGGHLTEIGLAGIVALRLQKNIAWDGPNMKVPGMPEADRFIHKKGRKTYL
jgi:predicted dehydrogenase